MKYNESMQVICDFARVKMTLNSHKGNIEGIDPLAAIKLARKELDELQEAVRLGNLEKTMVECGDVMNFLVSITYNAIERYRKRKWSHVEHPKPSSPPANDLLPRSDGSTRSSRPKRKVRLLSRNGAGKNSGRSGRVSRTKNVRKVGRLARNMSKLLNPSLEEGDS